MANSQKRPAPLAAPIRARRQQLGEMYSVLIEARERQQVSRSIILLNYTRLSDLCRTPRPFFKYPRPLIQVTSCTQV